MGAISKSEPIFRKLNTHHSRLSSLRYAKFRANRKICRDFGTPCTLNRTKIYMGAISKSEPIFTKLSTHHSALYRMIYRDFGASFTLNRTKIYMGAVYKFEPIFTKLNTHHSRPSSLHCAKFRANRVIYMNFGAPYT